MDCGVVLRVMATTKARTWGQVLFLIFFSSCNVPADYSVHYTDTRGLDFSLQSCNTWGGEQTWGDCNYNQLHSITSFQIIVIHYHFISMKW